MMNTKTLAGISVSAIGVGSFLMGLAVGMLVDCMDSKDESVETSESYFEEDDDETCEERTETVTKYSEITTGYRSDIPKIKLNPNISPDSPEAPAAAATEKINEHIHIITPEAFLNCEEETYIQTTLIWFEDDETMVDSRDDVLPEQEWKIMLGGEIEQMFGKFSDDKDVVYIRNDQTRMEYEVIREHSSYSKSVLGIGPSEEEYVEALKYFDIDKDGKD